MEKQKKLSKDLKKTIIQETVGSSYEEYLNNAETTPDVRAILNLMAKKLIKDEGVLYISIDNYISFFEKIPLKHWATKPIFYYRDEKWDALGLLGEKIHKYTLITKTLAFYYQDVLKMNITRVLDHKEPVFGHIENPKERMIASLEHLKEKASDGMLSKAYYKAKNITNGRYN